MDVEELPPSSDPDQAPPPPQALASSRALILNPSAPDHAVSSAFQSLLLLLRREQDPAFLRPAIKLLGDATLLRPSLVPSSLPALRPFLCGGTRLAADALAVILSVACARGDLHSVAFVLEQGLVLELASSHVVSVRSRVLELLLLDATGERGLVLLRGRLGLRVFLVLTEDLYPSVRRAALDGLAALCRSGDNEILEMLKEGVYERAITLLRDEDVEVRAASIRLISDWGRMLVANPFRGVDVAGISDAIFIQLCSMSRDMVMDVRIEAFVALGKVKRVSESVLLQSLSKKVLGSQNAGNSFPESTMDLMKTSNCSISSAAGAFIHGLEDEFFEVRRAACVSLELLTVFSMPFAENTLKLLMDLLNDDTTVVKLQTLETFLAMARHDRLKVQEIHMHMFLGMFADITPSIRHAARKVLRVMSIPTIDIFKSSVHGLLSNLNTYPEDEEDVILSMFHIGKHHGNFVGCIQVEFIQELEPCIGGELRLNECRAAALSALVISVAFSRAKRTYMIPQQIFSYVIPFLGKLSSSLRDIMDRDSLLVFLFHMSGMPVSSMSNLEEEVLPHHAERSTSVDVEPDIQCSNQWQVPNEASTAHFLNNMVKSMQSKFDRVQFKPERILHDAAAISIDRIFKTVAELWPFIKLQCLPEVLCTLRACKQELELISWSDDCFSSATVAFVLEYIEVIQQLAKLWGKILPRNSYVVGVMKLDGFLGKLDVSIRKLLYTFSGLGQEEEFHVLELTLLSCIGRLHRVEICSQVLLKKIRAITSRLVNLSTESLNLSAFVTEVKNAAYQVGSTTEPVSLPFNKLLKHFVLKQMPFSGRIRQIKAELHVPGNDSENPLPFISGLPLGISFQIAVYNTSKDYKLWLRLSVGNSAQYAYLIFSRFEGSNEVRRCKVDIPFYNTPKAAYISLKAVVVMECPFEPVTGIRRVVGGPKFETIHLCDTKDVYLICRTHV